MTVKLLTEHHLEFLSLKGGCIGSSESNHAKMPHCWKSHVTAHIIKSNNNNNNKILDMDFFMDSLECLFTWFNLVKRGTHA